MQESEWVSQFDDDTIVSVEKDPESEHISGLITSRPILSRIGLYETKLNYVDYLTVSRYSNKDASKTLFSTHEYNVRVFMSDQKASLIKQESGEYNGVVPFIKYELVQYHLSPWALPIMPPYIQLVSCNSAKNRKGVDNSDIINDFAKSFMDLPMFDVKIWAGLPALLRQKAVRMYALQSYGNTLGIYFMRNARTYYEELNGANTLECVGSLCLTDDRELFYGGFLLSIRESFNNMWGQTDAQQIYGVLSVPGLGHNVFLNNALPKKDVMLRVQSEYILHNMVAPKSPYSPERALIIL
jgi:hypothetical protein